MVWWLLLPTTLLVACIACTAHRRRPGGDLWPVCRRDPLSRSEQVLYWRLREACPSHVVLAQVAIAQLLEVEKGRNRQAVFNRYRQLVADFVVCTPAFSVVAVIELDDRSHTTPGRADADERKSAALGAAGVPLLRFNVRNMPSAGELRSLLVMGTEPAPEELILSSAPPQRHATA
jgi:very-short-patch-repair endonuclease